MSTITSVRLLGTSTAWSATGSKSISPLLSASVQPGRQSRNLPLSISPNTTRKGEEKERERSEGLRDCAWLNACKESNGEIDLEPVRTMPVGRTHRRTSDRTHAGHARARNPGHGTLICRPTGETFSEVKLEVHSSSVSSSLICQVLTLASLPNDGQQGDSPAKSEIVAEIPERATSLRTDVTRQKAPVGARSSSVIARHQSLPSSPAWRSRGLSWCSIQRRLLRDSGERPQYVRRKEQRMRIFNSAKSSVSAFDSSAANLCETDDSSA
jgi:hypothetical protein